MNWGTFIAIAITNGIPLAIKLAEKWEKRDQPVTKDELAELKALSEKTPKSQMTEVLKAASIDPESEEGKKLIGLVGGA